jgi:hypothetical protein
VYIGENCPLQFGGKVNPVKIVGVTAESFTFEALQGHIDLAGSTIQFLVGVGVGCTTFLEQYANAPGAAPLVDLDFPDIAHVLWSYQAENLADAVGGTYHSPYDGYLRTALLGGGDFLNHFTFLVNPLVNAGRAADNFVNGLF